MTDHIINERIRSEKLLVLHGNENLGVMSKEEALRHAREKELDLVLIAPQATPPVARILEYSKFLYDERKKKSASKSKSKKSELKELRLSATIGEGDLLKRAERAKGFIEEGNRVKISIVLRGREAAYPHIALDKVARFTKELEEVAKLESAPRLQGNFISAVYLAK